MIRIILLGILAALFFSSTFVLNRTMGLEGGHWFWTAFLRYAYMIVFLVFGFLITNRLNILKEILQEFNNNLIFWITAGSIGFGCFYGLISFSASYSPGWVIASTWQFTIVASPIVLVFFKKRIPRKVFLFTIIIFLGVIIVNASQFELLEFSDIIFGAVPVLIAGFCYPFGNQMIWESQNGGFKKIPVIDNHVLKSNPFAKVLLLSIGSLPFWLIIGIILIPPAPTDGQIINTAMVAVFSGILATSLFLFARSKARDGYELAAVDATQSAEVIFAMFGEIILLSSLFPNFTGLIGIITIIGGICFYIFYQNKK